MNKKILFVGAAFITLAAISIIALTMIRKSTTVTRTELPSMDGQTQIFNEKKILIIHSYQADWGWNIDTEKGIIDGLTAKGYERNENYELMSFYMDTKVTYILPGQIQIRADQAIKLIEDYRPDLVFINDDIALTYVAVPYGVKHPEENLPFIFSGINGDPTVFSAVIDSLEKPGHRITGALERFPFVQGYALIKRIFPDAEKIVLFADSSESSDLVIETMRADGVETDRSLALETIAIVQTDSFAEWQEKITEYQNKADAIGILTYHQLKNGAGAVVDASEVVLWTINHNNLPELGFLLFHSEDGFLSAVGVSPYKTGRYIGEQAADILSGTRKVGDIPITDPRLVDVAFNTRRAELLGVSIPIDILGLATQLYTEIREIRF